jgi:UDP-N-acetylglucosamine 2-epimerase (non-hydrolysing)
VGYAAMIAAVLGSVGVVTDSGGLQKEAYLLERPCTTLRSETEWVETLVNDWNQLVPSPRSLTADEWVATVTRQRPEATRSMPYGDGDAAVRAVKELASRSSA